VLNSLSSEIKVSDNFNQYILNLFKFIQKMTMDDFLSIYKYLNVLNVDQLGIWKDVVNEYLPDFNILIHIKVNQRSGRHKGMSDLLHQLMRQPLPESNLLFASKAVLIQKLLTQ